MSSENEITIRAGEPLQLSRVGEMANQVATRTTFVDYQARLAQNTLRR